MIVRGGGSAIVAALYGLLNEQIYSVPRDVAIDQKIALDNDRFLFCAGVLRPKSIDEQTDAELEEGYRVNLWQVTDDCERILSANDKARICVIGSESAYNGSYDGVYADAKRSVHGYVERKQLKPGQQIVCISPGPIEDCGQFIRRLDTWRTDERRARHPQKRFLKAIEVARLVHFVLYVDDGYLSNVVIRLNGGEHTTQRT
jgi:NAD(P)-dependent dehydrogenase (short-subunit alcohol dehydrogenase family)